MNPTSLLITRVYHCFNQHCRVIQVNKWSKDICHHVRPTNVVLMPCTIELRTTLARRKNAALVVSNIELNFKIPVELKDFMHADNFPPLSIRPAG